VVISLPGREVDLFWVVYSIAADGTIKIRRRMIRSGFGVPTEVMPLWTIIIELDNRFQPPEFNAVRISNPWITYVPQ